MFKNKQQKISGSRYSPMIPGVKDKLSTGYLYIPIWKLHEPNVSH